MRLVRLPDDYVPLPGSIISEDDDSFPFTRIEPAPSAVPTSSLPVARPFDPIYDGTFAQRKEYHKLQRGEFYDPDSSHLPLKNDTNTFVHHFRYNEEAQGTFTDQRRAFEEAISDKVYNANTARALERVGIPAPPGFVGWEDGFDDPVLVAAKVSALRAGVSAHQAAASGTHARVSVDDHARARVATGSGVFTQASISDEAGPSTPQAGVSGRPDVRGWANANPLQPEAGTSGVQNEIPPGWEYYIPGSGPMSYGHSVSVEAGPSTHQPGGSAQPDIIRWANRFANSILPEGGPYGHVDRVPDDQARDLYSSNARARVPATQASVSLEAGPSTYQASGSAEPDDIDWDSFIDWDNVNAIHIEDGTSGHQAGVPGNQGGVSDTQPGGPVIHDHHVLRPRPAEFAPQAPDPVEEAKSPEQFRAEIDPTKPPSNACGLNFKTFLCCQNCEMSDTGRTAWTDGALRLGGLRQFGHCYPCDWGTPADTTEIESFGPQYIGILAEALMHTFPNDGHQFVNDKNQYESAALYGEIDAEKGQLSQMMCPGGRPRIVHKLTEAKEICCDRFYVVPTTGIDVFCPVHNLSWYIFYARFWAAGEEFVDMDPANGN